MRRCDVSPLRVLLHDAVRRTQRLRGRAGPAGEPKRVALERLNALLDAWCELTGDDRDEVYASLRRELTAESPAGSRLLDSLERGEPSPTLRAAVDAVRERGST